MKRQYRVTNVYGIRGESTHRSPEAAIREARRREGEGWVVLDNDGNRWGRGSRGEAVIVREARQ